MKLTLEVNKSFKEKVSEIKTDTCNILITPAIDEDYWVLRVKLSKTQAIVAFPKFLTMGIGFQKETDWNTNLPYSCDAHRIYDHIKHNKGNNKITDEDCIAAIVLIQQALANYKK